LIQRLSPFTGSTVSFKITFHRSRGPHRTHYRYINSCPSSSITPCVHSHVRAIPEGLTRRFGKSQPCDSSRSALAVSHDFGSLLHTMFAGLLHPATGHEVDDVSGFIPTDTQLTEVNLVAGQNGPSPTPYTLRRIPLSQSRTASPRPVPSCRCLNLVAMPQHNINVDGVSIRPPSPTAEAAAPDPSTWWLSTTRSHLLNPSPAVSSDSTHQSNDDSPVGSHTIRFRKCISSFARIRSSTSRLFSPSESVTPRSLAKASTPYSSMGFPPLQDPFLPLDARWPETALQRRGGIVSNIASDETHATRMAFQFGN
jgi:hypothetical protein